MTKNRTVAGGRQFWDHCEKVAAEVKTWPGWMRGEMIESTDKPVKPTLKPMLRLGAYHHAWASEPRPDHPLRLERNRDGIYYWSMACAGQDHWWLTVNSTDSLKTGETGVPGSGTVLYHNSGTVD
jgi:hypothetical protein